MVKKKLYKQLFCLGLIIFIMENIVQAQVCSGSWSVGTSLNFICITGVSIGLSNSSTEPAGCPINPNYSSEQSNTFTFTNPVGGFTIDFKAFSSQASCARMEIKINGIFYPLTSNNLFDIPLATGCTGFFSFITLTNEGYITSTSNSLSSSNGHGRIIINGVNAASVTISTNDPVGTIVSTPFDCIDVVPLKLNSFLGRSEACQAFLNWETGTELNIRNIEVQRSTDGTLFNKVREITPKGSNSRYLFETSNVSDGYYRLKINDLDGIYSYSKILYLESSCDNITYKAIPNPASNQIEIIGVKNNSTILVLDMLGKIVQVFHLSPNNNKLDIQNLTPGMYIFHLINGFHIASLKVIKH